MPTTHTILRWMTHLNIGAFLATLLWLGWMHSMLHDAMPAQPHSPRTELQLVPDDLNTARLPAVMAPIDKEHQP